MKFITLNRKASTLIGKHVLKPLSDQDESTKDWSDQTESK